VKDEQFCAVVPGGLGAACDNFLTSNQLILNQAQWEALQTSWQNAGNAVECTTSSTVGDLKSEIEKLCSLTTCDYQTTLKLKAFFVRESRLREALFNAIQAKTYP
jgi:hypothetical protein